MQPKGDVPAPVTTQVWLYPVATSRAVIASALEGGRQSAATTASKNDHARVDGLRMTGLLDRGSRDPREISIER
jgi:hypothetical protein